MLISSECVHYVVINSFILWHAQFGLHVNLNVPDFLLKQCWSWAGVQASEFCIKACKLILIQDALGAVELMCTFVSHDLFLRWSIREVMTERCEMCLANKSHWGKRQTETDRIHLTERQTERRFMWLFVMQIKWTTSNWMGNSDGHKMNISTCLQHNCYYGNKDRSAYW